VKRLDDAALDTWLGFWRGLQCYHSYSVEGLERLEGGQSVLIAGYHGRPFAWDLCMLMAKLHDRLGYLPHGVIHRGVDRIPPLQWLMNALGALTRDDEARITAAVARGEHIIVTPGGAQEGCRTFRDRYRVSWGDNVGYLKLALKYRLPVVPVAAAGTDDTYIGLTNGPEIGKRLGLPRDWEWLPWLGIGPLGVFPFSPPFPVPMRQLIGEPIDLLRDGPVAAGDREGLLRLHRRVTESVQALLNRAVGRDAERAGAAA
jgi:1-acyl-sn-glycerol-3-phosphate acyltransferase